MARIACQVLHRSDRVSFLWSEGAAAFEPYHLEGAERTRLLDEQSSKPTPALILAVDDHEAALGGRRHAVPFEFGVARQHSG